MPRPATRLPRRAAPVAAVALALASAGCGEDACDGRPGAYAITVGPGTGTCGPEIGLPAEYLDLSIAPGQACGEGVLWQVVGDGDGCTADWSLTGVLDEDGVHDAIIHLDYACAAGGGCTHSYRATVTPAPAR